MDTNLEVVTLKNGISILFKEIKNSASNNIGIVYGNGVALYAKYITTEKSSGWQYTSYCSDPVKLFSVHNVIDRRSANDAEKAIFDKLSNNTALDKEDKEYLRSNYKKEA